MVKPSLIQKLAMGALVVGVLCIASSFLLAANPSMGVAWTEEDEQKYQQMGGHGGHAHGDDSQAAEDPHANEEFDEDDRQALEAKLQRAISGGATTRNVLQWGGLALSVAGIAIYLMQRES